MGSKLVSQEQIGRIDAALKNAPAIDRPLTVAETVKRLAVSIRVMRGRGYGWQQIADILRAEGVSISGDSLRRYMTTKRTANGTKAAGGRQK